MNVYTPSAIRVSERSKTLCLGLCASCRLVQQCMSHAWDPCFVLMLAALFFVSHAVSVLLLFLKPLFLVLPFVSWGLRVQDGHALVAFLFHTSHRLPLLHWLSCLAAGPCPGMCGFGTVLYVWAWEVASSSVLLPILRLYVCRLLELSPWRQLSCAHCLPSRRSAVVLVSRAPAPRQLRGSACRLSSFHDVGLSVLAGLFCWIGQDR